MIYDHNGNRLTQTQNGTLTQSFTYNQHDVLATGLNETPGWDLNGNMTSDTVNGQRTGYTYDDEDRLTSITLPDGHTDSFSYNGLGMRLTKQDPTGSYAYYTDGVSPASDVLSDNYSTFTPGISEINGQGSRFYLADASGNSRGLLPSSGAATDGYNWDAFGNLVSRFGTNPTMFAWNVSSGYQTDNDDGLTLLGHRYYDKRTGRFISQDHAKDGGNWYRYADNDPMNETDPSGLSTGLPGTLGAPDQHYSGFVGSDPFKLFGLSDGQSNTGNFQIGTGQGAAQQTQGPATPSTDLIFVSQGMEHPAPIIIDDWTASMSYGGSISFGPGRFSFGVGAAYDFYTRKLELFYQTGVFTGYGKGKSSGFAFTVGNDALGNFGGFNGPSFNVDGLFGSHGSAGYEWNTNYKGGEFSPPGVGPLAYTQRGNENGAFFGVTNTVPFGPTFQLPNLPSVPTLHF